MYKKTKSLCSLHFAKWFIFLESRNYLVWADSKNTNAPLSDLGKEKFNFSFLFWKTGPCVFKKSQLRQ